MQPYNTYRLPVQCWPELSVLHCNDIGERIDGRLHLSGYVHDQGAIVMFKLGLPLPTAHHDLLLAEHSDLVASIAPRSATSSLTPFSHTVGSKLT